MLSYGIEKYYLQSPNMIELIQLLKYSDDVKIGKRISMFIQKCKHSLTISFTRMYYIFASHLFYRYYYIVLNVSNCTHEKTK